jgi:hypothetical protein
VRLVSQLRHRPAFLPRKRPSGQLSLPLALTKPPVFDALSPEDRELFLTCKRGLSPEHLNELTEEAVEWLTEKADGDPTAFADDVLGVRSMSWCFGKSAAWNGGSGINPCSPTYTDSKPEPAGLWTNHFLSAGKAS